MHSTNGHPPTAERPVGPVPSLNRLKKEHTMPVTRFAAIAALAVASVSVAHAATDSSGAFRPDAPTGLTRAEVEADLALWQRAGLDRYTASEDSSATLSPQYQRQMALYQQWRSGPEYRAEVQRHGGTTIAGKAIGSTVSQN